MTAYDVKNVLTDDDIPTILEELGCEYIVLHRGYITATRGGLSDNRQGVVVWLNDFFAAEMYTTPEFDRFQVKDIFAVVQQLKEVSFKVSLDFVCDVVGITDNDLSATKESALSWLRRIKKSCCRQKKERDRALEKGELNQFMPVVHENWIQDGVSAEVATKFRIGFDVSTGAITIPIHNPIGDVVGIKARATEEDYESKYWYIYGCQKSNILYGLYQNLDSIKEKNEVIVFESEKSVLKACSLGINNSVALGGKTISQEQVRLLNTLGVQIILALDNDVTKEELEQTERKLAFPIRHNDIFFLTDVFGIFLSGKDSPADSPEMMKNYKKMITKEV